MSGSINVPTGDALTLMQAALELEAIVRDLAEREPSDVESYACGICRTVGATEPDPDDHPPICAWRRAVEWVAAHPQEAEQEGDEP